MSDSKKESKIFIEAIIASGFPVKIIPTDNKTKLGFFGRSSSKKNLSIGKFRQIKSGHHHNKK